MPLPAATGPLLLAAVLVGSSLVPVTMSVPQGAPVARAEPCPPAVSPSPEPSPTPSPTPTPSPEPEDPFPPLAEPGPVGSVPSFDAEPGPVWSVPPPGDPEPSDPAATPEEPTPAVPCPDPVPSDPADDPADGDDSAEVPRLTPEAGQPPVARTPSRLTGSRLTMHGLRIDGITDLPTADGTLRVLRFSMDRTVTDDVMLRVTGPAGTTELRSDSLTVAGDVKFYATRFAGRILGVNLALTPDSPLPPDGIPFPVPVIVVDDPDIQLVFVRGVELRAPGLRQVQR